MNSHPQDAAPWSTTDAVWGHFPSYPGDLEKIAKPLCNVRKSNICVIGRLSRAWWLNEKKRRLSITISCSKPIEQNNCHQGNPIGRRRPSRECLAGGADVYWSLSGYMES